MWSRVFYIKAFAAKVLRQGVCVKGSASKDLRQGAYVNGSASKGPRQGVCVKGSLHPEDLSISHLKYPP